MVGKAGAPALSPSPPSRAVCCMCGDHGLPGELFRCKFCLFRSQHKYCSDLYPKVETYRACNWCLREEGRKPADHNNSSTSSTSTGGSSLGAKLHRGHFPPHLNKPIKKKRVVPEPSEELSPSSGRAKPEFRGKARRYKLLEEVSS